MGVIHGSFEEEKRGEERGEERRERRGEREGKRGEGRKEEEREERGEEGGERTEGRREERREGRRREERNLQGWSGSCWRWTGSAGHRETLRGPPLPHVFTRILMCSPGSSCVHQDPHVFTRTLMCSLTLFPCSEGVSGR